ncbi:MAG TPA: glycosyltransferase family 2 protein [Vicinamibacterales bacterium]|nr:glycosyltransferase family 2 protein [Vicinamibacterales bacterium]
MPKLSVTIITKNEAGNIAAAIGSVAWANDVLVVDCGSTDATVEIARARGARVLHRAWQGFAEQKNYAAGQAAYDWILSLDADERVTPALADEIRALMAADPPPHPGYRIPRVSWYLGRWIRTTDWYPDRQLRLYDRRRGSWQNRRVHESVTVQGAAGRLTHEIQHRPYRDLAHHLTTMNRYTTLAAEEMYEQGQRSGLGSILFLPVAAFIRNYLLRRGFMQGTRGLIISHLNSYYVLLKFLKLWELQTTGTAADPGAPDPHVRTPEPGAREAAG